MVMSAVEKNKTEEKIWGIFEEAEQRRCRLINDLKEGKKKAERMSGGKMS